MIPFSAWLLVSLGPVVTVEGDAVCPTAADVAARLATLLPARATDVAPDVARLELREGALLVTLTGADGTSIGERALDSGFPCGDLASAAAVVIATWESDVHPEFRLAAPPAVPPPPPPPAPPVVTAAPPPSPPASTLDVGAGLLGSLAPGAGGVAPAVGAIVAGSWTPGGRRLGVRLALAGTIDRELPLGTGHVRWQRTDVALGPQLRLASTGAPWAVDLHAEAMAGWLIASGNGFATDLQDGTLDPGLGAGARLNLGRGMFVPWLEASLAAWLRQQAAYAGASVVGLPRFEATLALGLSYRAR
jgi:hypothetical protein